MVVKWFGQFEKLVPQKVTMAYRSEEKKIASLKEPVELPPLGSGIPEANSLQEKQKDMLLRATEGIGAVKTACSIALIPAKTQRNRIALHSA